MAMRPRLGLGSKDSAVAELVSILRAQGFWSEAGTPATFDAEVERCVSDFQMTHLGPKGRPLASDGVVGDDTWWALANASGPAQHSGIRAAVPKGLQPLRTKLLEVALAEHAKGVKEQPDGSNRGPDVDRYLPDFQRTKPEGPAWCCFFYSWVAHEALGSWPLGKREGSCMAARELADGANLWIPKHQAAERKRPFPGDAFVMDKGSGRGHIGYVLRVSEDGEQINTLEGNCGNRVKLGLREVADPQLAGYIDNVPSEHGTDFERGVVQAPKVGADGTR
jgi:hypothetical protein